MTVGRPSRLTPELMRKIADVVAQGGRFADACVVNGVSAAVGQHWLARGRGQLANRPATRLYRDFVTEYERALAAHRVRCKLDIRSAARGGVVIGRRQKRETKPDGTVLEETEERKTPPDWRAAVVDLRLEHPVEYPEPTVKVKHGLDEETANLVEQVKAVQARAHDPRALPPAPEDVVDAELVDNQKVIETPANHNKKVIKMPVLEESEERADV